jgi:hypothetical protein
LRGNLKDYNNLFYFLNTDYLDKYFEYLAQRDGFDESCYSLDELREGFAEKLGIQSLDKLKKEK